MVTGPSSYSSPNNTPTSSGEIKESQIIPKPRPHSPSLHNTGLLNLHEIYQIALEEGTTNEKNIKEINEAFIKTLQGIDPLLLEALDHSVNISSKGELKLDRAFSNKEISLISTRYESLLSKANQRKREFEELKSDLVGIKDQVKLDQMLANAAYYTKEGEFKEGDIIRTGEGIPDYRIAQIFGEEGLRAVYFVPLKKGEESVDATKSPVLSFRGTVPEESKNLEDDLGDTIGKSTFTGRRNREAIEACIERSLNPPGITLVGHSLGGSIAQLAAAEFVTSGCIGRVVHINAPGVGKQIRQKYIRGCRALESQDKQYPKVVNIYDHDDIVRHLGGVHIPTTERRVYRTNEKTRLFSAHTLPYLNERNIPRNTTIKEHSLKGLSVKSVLEGVRLVLSPVLMAAVKLHPIGIKTIDAIKKAFGNHRGQQIDKLRQKFIPVDNELPPDKEPIYTGETRLLAKKPKPHLI